MSTTRHDTTTSRPRRGIDIDCALLRRLRTLHPVLSTLEDLAAATGVSDRYLGNIERGERRPSGPVLHRICAALDVEPDTLMRTPTDNPRNGPGDGADPRGRASRVTEGSVMSAGHPAGPSEGQGAPGGAGVPAWTGGRDGREDVAAPPGRSNGKGTA